MNKYIVKDMPAMRGQSYGMRSIVGAGAIGDIATIYNMEALVDFSFKYEITGNESDLRHFVVSGFVINDKGDNYKLETSVNVFSGKVFSDIKEAENFREELKHGNFKILDIKIRSFDHWRSNEILIGAPVRLNWAKCASVNEIKKHVLAKRTDLNDLKLNHLANFIRHDAKTWDKPYKIIGRNVVFYDFPKHWGDWK